jgi:hypothetical protein
MNAPKKKVSSMDADNLLHVIQPPENETKT